MIGRVHSVDDKNDSGGIGIAMSSCIVEVLGIMEPGTTNRLYNYEAMPSLSPDQLKDLKRAWTQLSFSERRKWPFSLEVYDTHVILLKPSFVPHESASDSRAIENPDLLDLLYDSNCFYEKIGQGTVTTSAFQLIPGGPGCGKTEKICP